MPFSTQFRFPVSPLNLVTLPDAQDGHLPRQAPTPAEALVPPPAPHPSETSPIETSQSLEDDVASKSVSCSPPAAQRRRIGSAPVPLRDEYCKSQAVTQRANHSPQQQSSSANVFSPAQISIYTGAPGIQDFQIPPAYPMGTRGDCKQDQYCSTIRGVLPRSALRLFVYRC